MFVMRVPLLILVTIRIISTLASPPDVTAFSPTPEISEGLVPPTEIVSISPDNEELGDIYVVLEEVSKILYLMQYTDLRQASQQSKNSESTVQVEAQVDSMKEIGPSKEGEGIYKNYLDNAETSTQLNEIGISETKRKPRKYDMANEYSIHKEQLMKYHQELAFLIHVFNPQSPHAFRILCERTIVPFSSEHICVSSKFKEVFSFLQRCKEIFQMEKEAFRLRDSSYNA